MRLNRKLVEVNGSRWKSMEGTSGSYVLLCSGSKWQSVELYGSCWKFQNLAEVYRSVWKLVEVLKAGGLIRKIFIAEVYGTRGGRWRSIGVYGSSKKLPTHVVVEASVDGGKVAEFSPRPPHHRQWKLLSTSMDASINFHILPSTSIKASINFHQLPSTRLVTSIYFHQLPSIYFHGRIYLRPSKFPSNSVEIRGSFHVLPRKISCTCSEK